MDSTVKRIDCFKIIYIFKSREDLKKLGYKSIRTNLKTFISICWYSSLRPKRLAILTDKIAFDRTYWNIRSM